MKLANSFKVFCCYVTLSAFLSVFLLQNPEIWILYDVFGIHIRPWIGQVNKIAILIPYLCKRQRLWPNLSLKLPKLTVLGQKWSDLVLYPDPEQKILDSDPTRSVLSPVALFLSLPLLCHSTLPPPTFPVWIEKYTVHTVWKGKRGMGFWASYRKTPAAKSLYRSIVLDDDILHCLWVLSFYAQDCLIQQRCGSQGTAGRTRQERTTAIWHVCSR